MVRRYTHLALAQLAKHAGMIGMLNTDTIKSQCNRKKTVSEIKKGAHIPVSAPSVFWLPDLDSNQGPAD